MDIYKARLKNALKIAAKINRLLKKGFLILDDKGEKVNYPFVFDSVARSIHQKYSDNVRFLIFVDNKDYDMGLYTPIEKYNEKYKKFTFVNPKDLKKLVV